MSMSTAYPLLRGEAPALDSTHIAQILEKTERQLRACNDQLDHLQVEIISLENRKRDLQRQIETYKSLNAPIRSLPPEILRQIFVFACDDNRLAIGGHVPAMVLAGVCTIWRNICLSTAELWSRITVQLQDTYVEDWMLTLLDTLLTRSRQTSLTISASLWYLRQSEGESIMYPLIQHCKRWRHVELDLDFNPFENHNLWQLARGNLPLLQHLSVNGVVGDVFEIAPKLRSATLSRITSNEIPLPWEQITTLSLDENYNPRFLDNIVFPAVERCPQLQNLQIYEDSDEFDVVVEDTKVTTNANSLTLVVGQFFSPIIDGLSCIKMPKLKSVELFKYKHTGDAFITDDFLQFIKSTTSTLTSLSMTDIRLSSRECIQLLCGLPSLEEFEFSYHLQDPSPCFIINGDLYHPLSATLFSALCADSPNPTKTLVPNLRNLRLSMSVPWCCDADEAFVRMVKSRYRNNQLLEDGDDVFEGRVVNLERVELRLMQDRLGESMLAPLRSLAKRKMEIRVVDSTGGII